MSHDTTKVLNLLPVLYDITPLRWDDLNSNLGVALRIEAREGSYLLKSNGTKPFRPNRTRFSLNVQNLFAGLGTNDFIVPRVIAVSSHIDQHGQHSGQPGDLCFVRGRQCYSVHEWIHQGSEVRDPDVFKIGRVIGSFFQLSRAHSGSIVEHLRNFKIDTEFRVNPFEAGSKPELTYELSQCPGRVGETFSRENIDFCNAVWRSLVSSGIGAPGNLVIHGDLTKQNIIPLAHGAFAILDFEGVRLGSQTEDFAWATMRFCTTNNRRISFRRLNQFLRGISQRFDRSLIDPSELVSYMLLRCIQSTRWPFDLVKRDLAGENARVSREGVRNKLTHANENILLLKDIFEHQEKVCEIFSTR